MLTCTTNQFLDSLHDLGNAECWRVFDARFRPVLVALARQRGLSEEDAADVAQTTLVSFIADYQRGCYDPSRGRLSSWIMGIAGHRISDLKRAASRRQRVCSTLGIEAAATRPDEEAAWDAMIRKVILRRAMVELHSQSRFDPRTIRAFELCALRGVPAQATADECSMSVAEVYVAKNRVIARLREIVASLSEELAEP